ncbi:MAG: 16S rRNA (cytidine(1402)-2'-O)-methyltransferase [Chloroflexi bacterium]|nr:16S rRNA (cytidine(1402)-2'-O)-methyltransferase [Chloroflexota bacterium]
MGTLYLVATPIGNLEDISARALRTLREARLVAAEDTRRTRQLLTHFDIHTRLISYHEHNKLARLEAILAELAQGDVALVSDAGTPALNDPGYELALAALQAGYPVSPIPGPSAPLAALVASGLPTDRFLYLGYLPRKAAERARLLDEVAGLPYTLIFLETPHRLTAALGELLARLGDRPAAIARELTKLHEEILRLSLSEAQRHFTRTEPRGEFTLVIAGRPPAETRWEEARLRACLRAALEAGEIPSGLARRMAEQSGWARKQIYQLIHEMTP